MSVWQMAIETVATGEACTLVTILQTAGSAPREAGTRMLVTQRGQAGSIGGGNLEYVVTGQARALLASGQAFRVQSYPLGPLLGQCCGGKVRVLLERLDAGQLSFLAPICAAEQEGRPLGIVTIADGGTLRSRLKQASGRAVEAISLRDNQGRPITIQDPLEEGFVLEQTLQPAPPHLLIFGAGHVGQAVARIAATLPFQSRWYDERAVFASEPASLALEHTDGEAAVAAAPAQALYLILTHSHRLDYALVRAILQRDDFRYCGVIGSQTKRVRFEKRLVADGIPPELCRRLTCPVGAIGLTSKLPEVIAVAIAAELLLEVQNHTVKTSTIAASPR